MLVCGTHDGVHRVPALPVADTEQTLDAGRVWELSAGPGGVHAATTGGLYRSPDGADWEAIDLDRTPTSLLPAEEPVVGTRPLGVLRRTGDAWRPVGDIDVHPDAERWRDRAGDAGPAVRTLAAHPEHGILAGIEPGGVLAFDGDFWRRFGRGVHDDVHDLAVTEDGAVVAATGDGLYRTDDGETWYRLDTDFRDFWTSYVREVLVADGERVVGSWDEGPGGPLGVIFHGPAGEDRLERTELDLHEPAFPIAWAVHDGRFVAGTMRVGEEGFLQDEPAELLVRRDGEWETAGELPAGITSLAAVT